MLITDIETIVLPEIPFPQPIHPAWSPGVTWRSLSLAVVQVYTDDGAIGIGAGSARAAKRILERVRPALIGQDPAMIEKHVAFLGGIGGVWAVELALWDLLGKVAGLPLYQLWGGYADRVRAYASVTEVGTPEGRAHDALRMLEEGFRAIKLRVHNETLSQDIALVRAVRDAVGQRMEIMVDANQANVIPSQERGPVWDLQRAIHTAKALEDLDVIWLEEPLSRYDFHGLAELCSSVRLPIAGGENNRDIRDFLRMTAVGAYDIFQPDVMIAGVSNCKKVASLAEAAGKLAVGHHGGTGLGMVGRLHLNASCSNAPYVEYFYDPPKFTREVFQGLISEPLRVDADGYLPLPQGAGLGVALNQDFIDRYAVAL